MVARAIRTHLAKLAWIVSVTASEMIGALLLVRNAVWLSYAHAGQTFVTVTWLTFVVRSCWEHLMVAGVHIFGVCLSAVAFSVAPHRFPESSGALISLHAVLLCVVQALHVWRGRHELGGGVVWSSTAARVPTVVSLSNVMVDWLLSSSSSSSSFVAGTCVCGPCYVRDFPNKTACCICCEELEGQMRGLGANVTLPLCRFCRAAFHTTCLMECFSRHKQACPMCRQALSPCDVSWVEFLTVPDCSESSPLPVCEE